MCVCVCVCVCLCVCVCVSVCLSIHIRIQAVNRGPFIHFPHSQDFMNIKKKNSYIYMYINMYIYAHILMYIYVEIDVYMGGVDGDVCMYGKIRSLLLGRKHIFFFIFMK